MEPGSCVVLRVLVPRPSGAGRGSQWAWRALAPTPLVHYTVQERTVEMAMLIPCWPPRSCALPWLRVPLDFALAPLLASVAAPRLLLPALMTLLCEGRLLVRASHLRPLALVCETLRALTAPLQWPHVFVPHLPVDMAEFTQAPTPFLIGLRSSSPAGRDSDTTEDVGVTVLDLDERLLRGAGAWDGLTDADRAMLQPAMDALDVVVRQVITERSDHALVRLSELSHDDADSAPSDVQLLHRYNQDERTVSNGRIQEVVEALWRILQSQRVLSRALQSPAGQEADIGTADDEYDGNDDDRLSVAARIRQSVALDLLIARLEQHRELERILFAAPSGTGLADAVSQRMSASAGASGGDSNPATLVRVVSRLRSQSRASASAALTAASPPALSLSHAVADGSPHSAQSLSLVVLPGILGDPSSVAQCARLRSVVNLPSLNLSSTEELTTLSSTLSLYSRSLSSSDAASLVLRLSLEVRQGEWDAALLSLCVLAALPPPAPPSMLAQCAWPLLVHHVPLWDALFASASTAALKSLAGQACPLARDMHSAWAEQMALARHARLQRTLQKEAAERVEQRRVTQLSQWLRGQAVHIAPLSVLPRIRELRASLSASLSTVPATWTGVITRDDAAPFLAQCRLCVPEAAGEDLELSRLWSALLLIQQGSGGSGGNAAGEHGVSAALLIRFLAALDRTLASISEAEADTVLNLRARVSPSSSASASSASSSGSATSPSTSATGLSYSVAGVHWNGALRFPWLALATVERVELRVLVTSLPCARFTAEAQWKSSALEVVLPSDRLCAVAVEVAHTFMAAHALARDLGDLQPVLRATYAAWTALALSALAGDDGTLKPVIDGPLGSSSSRRTVGAETVWGTSSRRTVQLWSAARLAQEGPVQLRAEQRLGALVLSQGLLNHIHHPHLHHHPHGHSHGHHHGVPATPKSRAGSAAPHPLPQTPQTTPLVPPPESSASEAVLSAITTSLRGTSSSSTITAGTGGGGVVLSTPLRSRTAPQLLVPSTPTAHDSSLSGAAAAGVDAQATALELVQRALALVVSFSSGPAAVDWERLRASREYAQLTQCAAALATADLSTLGTDSERAAFWLNVHASMLLHGVMAIKAVPLTLLAWRLFLRFVSYDVGGLTYTLDTVRHLLRGREGLSQQLCMADRALAVGDPRLRYALRSRDPRLHFALGGLHEGAPRIRVHTAHNLERALQDAAEEFCEEHVRREGSVLVLPLVWAWYGPDFGPDMRALLQWLSAAKQREVAAALDSGQLQLVFEYDWTPRIRQS